ncbi:MAG: hypothetical protein HYR85_25885 [Planctomycetes bacterium]|nr:hypothetical protein [Planctomycetota bacterium]MBI3845320.1 hypothetical protein [Planctomycetota bacterium]
MPTKTKLNRSQAVRDYLKQNSGANPQAIVAALKAKGITISLSLANAVKYAKPKGATKKPAANAVGRPKGGVNRSQAIRDFMAQNPSAGPSAIRKGLQAKGIVVTDSLVGAIKYSKKRTSKPAGRPVGRPPGKRLGRPPAAAKNAQIRAEDLIEAKRFVDRVGGAGAARKALEILAQLS